MRLSHKHKFLYVAPPKTGSETIRLSLDKYSDIKGGPIENRGDFTKVPYTHAKGWELQTHFEASGWNWNEYFKFSVVRNPWNRAISQWKYQIKTNRTDKSVDFKEFVLSKQLHSQCITWTHDKKNNQIVDFIAKLENLQKDFNIICDKIGIPRQQLPHKNITEHKHYTEYYDEETKSIVAKKYRKDIEYFGYKFGK